MKKNIIQTIGLVITMLTLSVQFSLAQDNTFLYSVEGNGIQPSYIFGTIHILPNKDFHLSDTVKEAFTDSDVIALEMDMDDPKLQMSLMQHIMMKGDTTLDQLLSTEDYAKLDEELKSIMGVGVGQFNKMKPFFIVPMLLGKYLGEQPASFEATFIQLAAQNEQEIVGLETVEEQMSVTDAISYQEQAESIIEMLNDDEETKKLYDEMIALYKDQDVEGLYNVFSQFYEEDADLINTMLDERNQKWIPTIGELAKDQSVFFGFGAGHLGGDQGVINLLKEAGYTVTPVPN